MAEELQIYEIWGFRSASDDEPGCLGCDAVFAGLVFLEAFQFNFLYAEYSSLLACCTVSACQCSKTQSLCSHNLHFLWFYALFVWSWTNAHMNTNFQIFAILDGFHKI